MLLRNEAYFPFFASSLCSFLWSAPPRECRATLLKEMPGSAHGIATAFVEKMLNSKIKMKSKSKSKKAVKQGLNNIQPLAIGLKGWSFHYKMIHRAQHLEQIWLHFIQVILYLNTYNHLMKFWPLNYIDIILYQYIEKLKLVISFAITLQALHEWNHINIIWKRWIVFSILFNEKRDKITRNY